MCDKSVRRLICLLLFVIFPSLGGASAFAQMGRNSSGTGGRNTIQGNIFTPNGMRPSDASINVRLESTSNSALSVIADRNGDFSFTNLIPGSYTIVIDAGENFEIAREPVYIDESPSSIYGTSPGSEMMTIPSLPKTVRVPVYLQLKKNAPINNKILDARLANIPKDALKHYEKGVEFAQSNKTQEAVGELKQAVAIYPRFSAALAELGRQYLKLGSLDEAVGALRSSVAVDPKYFDAKLDYGIALLNKKDLNAAEKELRDAAALNPDAVTPHYYLGLTLVEKQNLEAAEKELELGKKASGGKGYPQITLLLSRIYFELSNVYFEKKQYGAAADELEKYLQIASAAKDVEKIRQVIKDLRIKQANPAKAEKK